MVGTKKNLRKYDKRVILSSRKIAVYCSLALSLKIIVILGIPRNIWFGADAENYLKGYFDLAHNGIFTGGGTLLTWPAGYSIVLFLFSFLHSTLIGASVSILQSAIFSYAVFFFTRELTKTKISRASYLLMIILLFNPTFSLSSMLLGYESLVGSIFLLVAGLFVRDSQLGFHNRFFPNYFLASFLMSIACFLEARFIPICILILSFWFSVKKLSLKKLWLLFSAIFLVLTLPLCLVARNIEAGNGFVISKNLGYTMAVGNGDGATGGYDLGETHKPCRNVESDRQQVQCVLNWDITHPIKDIKLIWNKSIYFWSPWSGPVQNGTMARNPWNNLNPVFRMEHDPIGYRIVFGPVGYLISYLWIIGELFLMIYGFIWVRKLEKMFANILGSTVLLNWLIAVGTIGDNRFRLPLMGFSLTLQGAGLLALINRQKYFPQESLSRSPLD